MCHWHLLSSYGKCVELNRMPKYRAKQVNRVFYINLHVGVVQIVSVWLVGKKEVILNFQPLWRVTEYLNCTK